MGRVRNSVHIDAPPQIAWEIARDPTRIPQWNTTVVAVKDVTGPLDQPGTTYTAMSKVVGRPLDIHWRIDRVEPMRRLEASASAPGGGSAHLNVEYLPEGGGTTVSVEVDYELPLGFLGDMADRLFAERALTRDLVHSGENFKALVEEEAAVPTR
jgi:uncharacterized protein YndB with AHSA1/START domain